MLIYDRDSPGMKQLTGYNALAGLAVVCATVVVVMGRDLQFATTLVALAGTVAGRGKGKS